ncbi:MAG: GTP pyrophosphokinase family protein [Clostridiales bacterium]|nr:GTP pyrophosphokinase family protein [Clostridiales bacterium]
MNQKYLSADETIIGQNEIGMLYSSYHDFQQLRHLYNAAVREIQMRLEVLNDEFNVMYARSPIHHIESRLKSTKSIVDKLKRKNLSISTASAKRNVNDIAGIRVVCGYIDDVYRVEEMLMRQTDIELVKRQDYIKTPNYNGYRSLHLDVRVPVFLSDSTQHVLVEIQIRSVAMDFWASLEHDLRYKADKAALPSDINEQMLQCADEIAEIDRKMQDMYRRIQEAK